MKKQTLRISWLDRIVINCRKGNAILVSVVTVSLISLTTIGAASLIMDTSAHSKDIERAVQNDSANESAFEIGAYDVVRHAAGYEVEDGADTYNVFQFSEGNGEVFWEVENRAAIITEGALTGYMVYPSPGFGDSADGDWMTIHRGNPAKVQLFVDNTSKIMRDDGAGGSGENLFKHGDVGGGMK